jgi:hypothetical protein
LNANCNGIIPPELARIGAKKAGKKTGEKHKRDKTAICDPANQEKGRQTARERGSGFFDSEFQQSEMMQGIRRQNGIRVSQTPEAQKRLAEARAKVDPEKRRKVAGETGKRIGKINAESGHMDRIRMLRDPEKQRQNALNNLEKMNTGRWKCLVTGHVSSYVGLSRFQNNRGIDRKLRIQVG